MTRFVTVCAVLFAFFIATPLALAQPPDEGDAKVEAKADDAKAVEGTDAKTEEKADAKAEDAKVDDAKVDEKATEGSTEGADEPTTEEMVEGAKAVVSAAQEGEWALMVSGIIMLLLAVGRRFKVLTKLPSDAVPWVSMVLGILAVVADNLAGGGEITGQRLMQGVLAGMAASGAWGMIGKHLPVLGGKKAAAEG